MPLARGAIHGEPFYKYIPMMYYHDEMLPKLKEVFGPDRPHRLHAPFGPWTANSKPLVTRLLNIIGGVLHPVAKRRTIIAPRGQAVQTNMIGSKAFVYPLTKEEDGQPVCMVYDADKLRETRYMSRMPAGYISIYLGTDHSRREVKELAHRVVLWAIKGPPPLAIKYPVAMHTCNNTRCLNPLHLDWGENMDNVRA